MHEPAFIALAIAGWALAVLELALVTRFHPWIFSHGPAVVLREEARVLDPAPLVPGLRGLTGNALFEVGRPIRRGKSSLHVVSLRALDPRRFLRVVTPFPVRARAEILETVSSASGRHCMIRLVGRTLLGPFVFLVSWATGFALDLAASGQPWWLAAAPVAVALALLLAIPLERRRCLRAYADFAASLEAAAPSALATMDGLPRA